MYYLFETEAEKTFNTKCTYEKSCCKKVVKCFNFIDHNIYLEKLVDKASNYEKHHPSSKTKILKLESI